VTHLLAHLLRRWADRIDDAGAPHAIGWSFTFEHREGIRFREDGKGCPLWYLRTADYERAHTEADTSHAIVDWPRSAIARFGR
jgi:hypothetical protein